MPVASMDTLMAIVNRERAARGHAALATNGTLANAALGHSADMLGMHRMTHDGSDGSTLADRLNRLNYPYSTAGEIIAASNNNPLSEQDVVNLWINSPRHFAIMFSNDYSEMGGGESSGYWTIDFGKER
jgi:uncharacterized protein YkwD